MTQQFQQRPSGLIVPGEEGRVVTPQQMRQPMAVVPLEQVMGLLAMMEELVIPTLQFYANWEENSEAVLEDKGARAADALAKMPIQAGDDEGDDVQAEQSAGPADRGSVGTEHFEDNGERRSVVWTG